ncbi:MAG: YtoQ family protein [Cyclobacteriaceae bacterium]
MLPLSIYLSGEIHSDWREELQKACQEHELPVKFFTPVVTHQASDEIGQKLHPELSEGFWRDQASSSINQVRIRTGIDRADLVIIRFGEKYRQWNAAFDAGYCAAKGKPYLVIHPEDFTHALKEVDNGAFGVATTTMQAVEIISYISTQK